MSFTNLGLSDGIVRAVTEHGYTTPTPIQQEAIPAVLAGRDMMAGAQTGTGKTAAFVLPILQRLAGRANKSTSPAKHPVRCLILTPTRELAAQVEASVMIYGKHVSLTPAVVYGGVSMHQQIKALQKGVDILVATPGRLLDHVQSKTVNLGQVEILVLDEADRMLDMGFMPDLRKIVALLPKKRQTLLFSATFSDEIKKLAQQLLNDPTLIQVTRNNAVTDNVTQTAYAVHREAKRALLVHLIKTHDYSQVLVFTRTKHGANRLSEQLQREGIASTAIHGNKTQPARTEALEKFKAGKVRVLVATDIAARGLDIDHLPCVINYELPNVAEDYVHRIGRTARAGKSGDAISLVSPEEAQFLSDIERMLKQRLPYTELPGFTGDSAKKDAVKRVNGRSSHGQDLRRRQENFTPREPIQAIRQTSNAKPAIQATDKLPSRPVVKRSNRPMPALFMSAPKPGSVQKEHSHDHAAKKTD